MWSNFLKACSGSGPTGSHYRAEEFFGKKLKIAFSLFSEILVRIILQLALIMMLTFHAGVLFQVTSISNGVAVSSMESFMTELANSGWLKHVKAVLDTSVAVVQNIVDG